MKEKNEEKINIETKEVKIILLGETGVGKTSIINRFINNEFINDTIVTLGSSFSSKEIKKYNVKYRLKIWDTTGQEQYHSITNLYIKGSNIVILIYSIDSLNSFEQLNYWYSAVKEKLDDDKHIVCVVGNKSDLKNNMVVTEEEGKKFATEKKCLFKLVSAKEDPESINKLFDVLLEELTKINFESRTESYIIQKKTKKKKKQKQCSC